MTYLDTIPPDQLTLNDLNERWWADQDREQELKDFFSRLDTADPSWLAEEENRLQISMDEWATYHRTKKELAEARYARSPF